MVRRNVLPKAQADTAKSQLASADSVVRSAQSKVDRVPVRIELAEAIDTLPTRVGGRANIMTDWVVGNCLAASVAVFLATCFFPTPPTAVSAPALPTAFAAPIPPLAAALALTAAAWAVWIIGSPTPGALLVSVVIGLGADGEPPGRTLRDRFAAALLGAGLAYAALVLMLVRGRHAGAAAPPASR